MSFDIDPQKLRNQNDRASAPNADIWTYTADDFLRSQALHFIRNAQRILNRKPPAPPLSLEEVLAVKDEVFWRGDKLRDADWTSGDRLEALRQVLSWQGKPTHSANGPLPPDF